MESFSQRFVAAVALAFAIGGAAGYFAGNRPAPMVAATSTQAPDDDARFRFSQRSPETAHTSESGGAETPGAGISGNADFAGAILTAVRARDYFQRRHDIYALGQQLDRDTIRAAMDAAQQLADTDREHAQYPLLARWLELDAAAAYEWVSAVPKQSRRSELMREFFHSLGMKDPAAALTFLKQYQANPNRGEDFSYSVFEAWSAHDPGAAVDAALSFSKKELSGSGLSVALGRWAKRDPHGALARIAQFPDAEMRRTHLRAVLHEWAEEDPQAAANHASSLPAGKERNDAITSVISAAAATDRDVAMRLIEQLPPGAVRNSALSQIVDNLSHKEPKLAAEFLLALPPGQQRNSVHQVIHSLARQDRAAALEWAGRLTSADARKTALQQIVQEWSSDDPKAAAEYCVSNEIGTPDVLGNAVENWAREDFRAALAWAGALQDSALREAVLGRALGVLGASDPSQAAALATTLLSGRKQAEALGSIAGAWASKDPAAAAVWAGRLSDSNARISAASNIAHIWARQDPAAAAAWAAQSPETSSQLSTITREWASQDPVAAAQWLETLPSGNTRDSALSSFSNAVVDVDPESAVAWAAAISQPQQRDNTLSNVFREWKNADPKAADTWLRATSALSAEARARLLR